MDTRIEAVEESIKTLDVKLSKLRMIVSRAPKLEKKLFWMKIQRHFEHDRAELRRQLFDLMG